MENKILYQLTAIDFQTVAKEEIGRELSTKEIESILKSVEQRIEWYSIIADAITENIKPK